MSTNPYQSPADETAPAGQVCLPRPIRLHGAMTFQDALNTHLLLLRRRWLIAFLFVGSYLGFVLAVGFLSPSQTMIGETILVLGLFILPAFVPFTVLISLWGMWRDARRRVGRFAVTKSELSTEGIATAFDGTNTKLEWERFDSFVLSPTVILLFFKGSTNHLIVTRSKIQREDDWTLLADFLQQRFRR